jgi:hypothetical protein
MNMPNQAQPVARRVLSSMEDDEKQEHFQGGNRSSRDSAQAEHGIEPLGYQRCYALRGLARQMCLSRY